MIDNESHLLIFLFDRKYFEKANCDIWTDLVNMLVQLEIMKPRRNGSSAIQPLCVTVHDSFSLRVWVWLLIAADQIISASCG